MARVVLEQVSKDFRRERGEVVHAVRDLSLSLASGELLVLVGPSGCGKTTVLRLVAGLEEVSGGTVMLDDQVVNQWAPKDRGVAMVFQNPALYPHLTAAQNLALGLRLRGVREPERSRRVRAVAEGLSLGAVLDRLPRALSGGERQRVALGRALVWQPRVLLLDEPLSNLDGSLRVQMRWELRRLQARTATTMIHVTHDQAEAMALGDRLAVLREGRLQQVGPPPEVYRRPANRFVAAFIGSPPMNFLSGRLEAAGDHLEFCAGVETVGVGGKATASGGIRLRVSAADGGRLRPYLEREVVLGVRPEHLTVMTDPGAVPVGWGTTAQVEGVEWTGPDAQVHAVVGAQKLIARSEAGARFGRGTPVGLRFDLEHAHWFEATTDQAVR